MSDTTTCCAQHDRLDLKLSAEAFTSRECGSLNAETAKAEFCCFECPTLTQPKAPDTPKETGQ